MQLLVLHRAFTHSASTLTPVTVAAPATATTAAPAIQNLDSSARISPQPKACSYHRGRLFSPLLLAFFLVTHTR